MGYTNGDHDGSSHRYWWRRGRRIAEPTRSLLLLGISTVYLMLFNPMNESNTYVIAAPAIALLAVTRSEHGHSKRLRDAMIVSLLVAGLLPELVRPIIQNAQLWLKPTAAIFWAVALVVLCEREVAEHATGEPMAPDKGGNEPVVSGVRELA